MFGGKRRRAASNPPLNASNANPSATSAAAQAFLKNQASTVSLSSAAAAAALKNRPMTPTLVADVQTKRMMRRAGSNSSMGSTRSAGSNRSGPISHRGPPGAQLERRGSSGSMTERTFREPSPNRSQHVPSAADAPPVPAIPKNLNHQRASSLQPPLRIASPTPNKATGRGSSLQNIGNAATLPRRSGQRSSLSSIGELTRPESRGAPRITAPNNQNLIYDPNTRKFLPAAEIHAIEQKLWDIANAPVKKQKRVAPKQGTGKHLADGTVGGRPRGTAVDALNDSPKSQPSRDQQTQAVEQPVKSVSESRPLTSPEPAQRREAIPEQNIVEKRSPTPASPSERLATTTAAKRKKKVAMSESGSEQGSVMESDNDADRASQPSPYNTRAGALLAKKPSMVREDRKGEEEEDDTPKRASLQSRYPLLDTTRPDARTVSPSPLPRSQAGRAHNRGQTSSSTTLGEENGHFTPSNQSTPAKAEPVTPVANGTHVSRKASVSPSRNARFSATPESLAVMHQPPGRSVSPRKSALKHSPSTRENSPSAIPGSFQGGSEVSDNSVTSDDFLKPKRKSVRVSFDDESNVVVGHAAPSYVTDSPVVQSPQVKKGWFNIGRGKKKDLQTIEDDSDEIMKPRPALPSFGSVRDKKVRESESGERPLVVPSEAFNEPAAPSPVVDHKPDYSLGQSNDHVVGAIISQDHVSRNTANISKSREPLPPEVTSVEGTGDLSDDTSSTFSMDEKAGLMMADASDLNPMTSTIDSLSTIVVGSTRESTRSPSPEAEAEPDHTNGLVPEIAILPATPKLDDDPASGWPNMPGGWSGNTSDTESQEHNNAPSEIVEHHPTDPSPSAIGIAEPVPENHQPPVGEIATTQHHHEAIMEETEDSDSSGVYSDAAEDLSDLEGDGFMSLDAVVESPVPKDKLPSLVTTSAQASSPPESPTLKMAKARAYERSPLQSTELNTEESWDKAQQYWSGLTAEKKRILEDEAREDAAADASSEEEVKPAPKPKKTKKKTAVQAEVQRDEPAQRSDRTYMIAPGSKTDSDGYTPVRAAKPANPAKTTSMRTSMRAEPASIAPEPQMRKSMRGPASNGGSMRGSMRDAAPTQPKATTQKYRPVSLPATDVVPDPAAVSKHLRHMSASSASTAKKPTLRRQNSGDSDSSFKRVRAKPDNSRFRGSMRGSTDEPSQSAVASSRFSLRSLSPSGSTFRRPFNSQNSPATPAASMRPSIRENKRDSYDSPKGAPSPRLSRNKSPSASSMLGFGRNSTKAATPKAAPTRRSRFADSDSEEEARPAFRSRFADSDSEDDEPLRAKASGGFGRGTMRASAPARSAPIRTTPKQPALPTINHDEDDSSDLPDSDDEKSPKLPPSRTPKTLTRQNGGTSNAGTALAVGSVRRSGSGRGTIAPPPVPANASTSSRPGHARHGSFMSSILRRKKTDTSSRVTKVDAESPARRDTPLERSKSDRAALYGPLAAESPGRVMSPKLQKRNPMSRENSSSWPLAGPVSTTNGAAAAEDSRPVTSDGANGIKTDDQGRPALGSRRFTATGLSAVDVNVANLETPRKKKKFQALRKMFRLDD
ncbi:hypothetical protein PVAG01_06793 [Phlyctema vagabunda]|uniref:MUC1 Extracellular alpha-1,4-glucan glucosidase n=1 Tax=Phlyctema vagabunda TaxID=108571 RepID=A0ABR4PH26_9HELO